MTTWTCKTTLAVTALFALTACDAVPVLDSLSAPAKPAASVALSQSQMANGRFTLVPPQGFCIDKSSLKQRFALMARCDTLGAPSAAGGAPLAIITVSVTPEGTADTLPTPEQTVNAAKLTRATAAKSENDAVTFRAEGPPPATGLDTVHWRGTARIGGQIVGVALYGPKGGRAVSSEGREMLNGLIRRSKDASASGA